MAALKHTDFYIITYLINQINFNKGFSTNKIPADTFFRKIFFVIKDVIYSFLGNRNIHALI